MEKYQINQIGYMKNFECSNKNCPDICCSGWRIDVGKSEYSRIKDKAPDLINLVEKNGSEDDYKLKQDENGNCLALQDGLCSVYLKYGTDFQFDICHFFPRTYRKIRNEIFQFSDLSCPEVAKLALFADKGGFSWSLCSEDRIRDSLCDFGQYLEGLDTLVALEINNKVIQNIDKMENLTPDEVIAKLIIVSKMLDNTSVCFWPKVIDKFFRMSTSDRVNKAMKTADDFDVEKGMQELLFSLLQMEKHSPVKNKYFLDAVKNIVDNFDKPFQEKSDKWLSIMKKYDSILKNYIKVQICTDIFPLTTYFHKNISTLLMYSFKYKILRMALISSENLLGDNEVVMLFEGFERVFHNMGKSDIFDLIKEYGLDDEGRMLKLLLFQK